MGYLALNEIVAFCNLPLHLSKPLSSVYSPNWFFKLSNRGNSTTACCISRNHRIFAVPYSSVLSGPVAAMPFFRDFKLCRNLDTNAVTRNNLLLSLYLCR